MPSLVSDVDTLGQFDRLLDVLTSSTWADWWKVLQVPVLTFEDLGLSVSARDSEVWHKVQEHDAVLVTGNRNESGTDSLGYVIRTRNKPQSLPVITYGDAQAILNDSIYRKSAAVRLLEILLDFEQYRGAGRLYIP